MCRSSFSFFSSIFFSIFVFWLAMVFSAAPLGDMSVLPIMRPLIRPLMTCCSAGVSSFSTSCLMNSFCGVVAAAAALWISSV